VKQLAALVVAATSIALVPSAAHAAAGVRCFHTSAPYKSYAPVNPRCASGYALVDLKAGTAQVLTVTNWLQTRTWARLNAWHIVNGSWVHRWGPWSARIGAGGFASPGRKIEGDSLTPQGSYGFQFMFGVYANPGVHFRWRHAYRHDYWDDDPASARYNLWTNINNANAGANPEPMHQLPVYSYSAVIAYNTARVPGKGSAIFLHVGDGQATAGCVSLPRSRLLTIIRWLRPGSHPVITMEFL